MAYPAGRSGGPFEHLYYFNWPSQKNISSHAFVVDGNQKSKIAGGRTTMDMYNFRAAQLLNFKKKKINARGNYECSTIKVSPGILQESSRRVDNILTSCHLYFSYSI